MTTPFQRRARLSFALKAVVLVAVAAGIGWSIGEFRKNRKTTPPAEPQPIASKRGALLYQTVCANCHGPEGKGDGVSAAALQPPPRDFAARPWRFEPTKEAIRRVIRLGVSGTAMPGSEGALAEADLDALVEYVYDLATSRPTVAEEPSLEEQLLKAAGLVNLHGSDPPPLRVSDVSGRITQLADLRGKLVVVHFWGTACAPV